MRLVGVLTAMAFVTGCGASFREQLDIAVARKDNARIVALQQKASDSMAACAQFAESCAAVTPLAPACASEAKSHACETATSGGTGGGDDSERRHLRIRLAAANDRLEKVALADLGANLDAEKAINDELERALKGRLSVKELTALLERFAELQRQDQARREYRSYRIYVISDRVGLAMQAAKAALERSLRFGGAEVVALHALAKAVETNASAFVDPDDVAEAAKEERKARAKTQAAAREQQEKEREEERGRQRVAADLASDIEDRRVVPAPWAEVRVAIRARTREFPATAALLRRALHGSGFEMKEPAEGAVAKWLDDKSVTGVKSVQSCPVSGGPRGELEVRGVMCGTERRQTYEGSSGKTSTSTVRYRDGSGVEVRKITTTTPDIAEAYGSFASVTGAFQFELGALTVTVPFKSRELDETTTKNEAQGQAAPVSYSIFKNVMDVARTELVAAREKTLTSLRSQLEANRGRPKGDEAAAQLLMLSIQPEPRAAEYFKGRFSLPADVPRAGWSNASPP